MDASELKPGETPAFADTDATRHLRDHLECAHKLAHSQKLAVVQYLVQMAILALSGVPASLPKDK